MTQIDGNRRRPSGKQRRPAAVALTLALIALSALLLSACGGSSSKSTAGTATSKTTGGARGQFAQRGAALRECLQKNGITVTKRNPGQTRKPGTSAPFGGAAGGGGFQLPKGVTRAQLQAAFKKCGGDGRFAGGGGLASAAGRRRFAKFATCMRANGIKLPTPNATGEGPIFNTKGIDTTSAKFKAAESKCMHELTPGGAGRAGGPGAGAPGARPGEAGQGEAGGPAGTPGGPPVGEAGAPPAG